MKTIRLYWFVVFFLAFLPSGIVSADIGPKPTMDFKFESNLDGGQVTITSGILYECEQADCADASPLEELGPQRLTCEEFHCSAIAYGFAPYHRLEIQFSDGATRQSNIFETIDFDSVYLVTVNADDLVVEEVSGSSAPPFEDYPAPQDSVLPTYIVVGCICILLLIGVIAFAIIFFVRRSRTK